MFDAQAYLDEFVAQHKIPAASLAVWKNGELSRAATGILNLETGVEATTDSIFQIGSITKVFTTCLIMKLVEDGRIDLNAPVADYIRGFEIADKKAIPDIKVRHLLNHTSGIAGDYFPDDLHLEGPHIPRLVDKSSQLPLVHPVGDGFSYSNSAFSIAGRIVEIVSGLSWFDAMEKWIFEPLGLTHAICRPEDVIRYRTAIGHVSNDDADVPWKLSSGKYLTLGHAPAGTTPTMRAEDLIVFARAHLANGVTSSGAQWLSEKSIAAMRSKTVNIPRPAAGVKTGLGLGWFMFEHSASNRVFIDHGGATNGQCATLRLFPDREACFALLMNVSSGPELAGAVKELTELIGEYDFTEEGFTPVDLSERELIKFVGTYSAYAGDYKVSLNDERLAAQWTDAVDEEPPQNYKMRPIGDDCFEFLDERCRVCATAQFTSPNERDAPQKLSVGVRLFQRAQS